MKKGDGIQRRVDVLAGKQLMHGFTSVEKAEQARHNIGSYYNLSAGTQLKCTNDELNPGKYALVAKHDTYIILEAKVNWVVDREAGITFPDGGLKVINLDEDENKGWVVVKSAVTTYQSGVEHMSDEELRASIEALRSNRVCQPVRPKSIKAPKQPPMSAQDKALTAVLGKMDAGAREALQRKLGLI